MTAGWDAWEAEMDECADAVHHLAARIAVARHKQLEDCIEFQGPVLRALLDRDEDGVLEASEAFCEFPPARGIA